MTQTDLLNNPDKSDILALVEGQPITRLPKDLYIPPEALKVFLDTFQGPLDLLLYLIKKQNLDILNIPITEITRQYIQYVELMKILNLELAGEYLVMAALLAEIKSRLLLPKPPEIQTEETDPRAELIKRLQEYEKIKAAADNFDHLPQLARDIFQAGVQVSDQDIPKAQPQIDFKQLIQAFMDVMHRASLITKHAVEREHLSVRERMSCVLLRLQDKNKLPFHALFTLTEGKAGVVVTFIAILELLKQMLIDIIPQTHPYSPIFVKAMII